MGGYCLPKKRVFRSTRVLVSRPEVCGVEEEGEGAGGRSTLFLFIKLHFSCFGLCLKLKVVYGQYQALI